MPGFQNYSPKKGLQWLSFLHLLTCLLTQLGCNLYVCIFHVIFTRSVLGETAGGPWCVKLESELQPSLTVYAGSAEDEKYDSDKENSSHAGAFAHRPIVTRGS